MLSKELFNSAETLRGFLTAVDKITAQFSHQAKRYSDTRAGNVASGLVAAEGARFKRRNIGWISLVAAIALWLIYILIVFL
jgi:hypothetical protein